MTREEAFVQSQSLWPERGREFHNRYADGVAYFGIPGDSAVYASEYARGYAEGETRWPARTPEFLHTHARELAEKRARGMR